jgi:hypothetical protein
MRLVDGRSVSACVDRDRTKMEPTQIKKVSYTAKTHIAGGRENGVPRSSDGRLDLILGQKSVSGSPSGSPTAIDDMLEFSARHSIAPITKTFPMSKVNEAKTKLRMRPGSFCKIISSGAGAQTSLNKRSGGHFASTYIFQFGLVSALQ